MTGSSRLYINIREAMSYDIKLHGEKLVIAEFSGITTLAAGILFLYAFYPLPLLTRLYGLFWLGFFLNSLTILILSIDLARHGTRRERERKWSKLETSKLRRYTILIGLVIIVPYAALIIALIQHFRGIVRPGPE